MALRSADIIRSACPGTRVNQASHPACPLLLALPASTARPPLLLLTAPFSNMFLRGFLPRNNVLPFWNNELFLFGILAGDQSVSPCSCKSTSRSTNPRLLLRDILDSYCVIRFDSFRWARGAKSSALTPPFFDGHRAITPCARRVRGPGEFFP